MTETNGTGFELDPGFRDLIRPLSEEEHSGLEKDLMERGCLDELKVWNGLLVDGHHRFAICQKHELSYGLQEVFFADRKEAEVWILRNQLSRRNLSDVQRYRIGEQIREREAPLAEERRLANLKQGNEPRRGQITPSGEQGRTNEKVGAAVGLSETKYKKLKKVEAEEPKLLNAIDEGRESVNSAYRQAQKRERARQKAAERAAAAEAMRGMEIPDRLQLFHGDFRDILDDQPEESVDLVFTDPPYGEPALPLWSDLGKIAADVLRPGGFLIAYSGQIHLPEVFSRVGEHLEYFWTLSVEHTHGQRRIWQKHMWNSWKPLIAWRKPGGGIEELPWLRDKLNSGDATAKDYHEWAQPITEAETILEKFCPVGGLVLDPMCGSATIPLAALLNDRRAVGVEESRERYEAAWDRVRVALVA